MLPDDKWLYAYNNDIEVEMGMTWATWDANKRERKSTDGEFRFPISVICKPIPLTERAVQQKFARKVHGKRRSKKNLESLYQVLAPGSNIIKESPTTYNPYHQGTRQGRSSCTVQ